MLNPAGSNDLMEPDRPGGYPAGYSSSNNLDGLSFAQDRGLERSAVFAGGSARVLADEYTHRGDILIFSGLAGAESARVTFGLGIASGLPACGRDRDQDSSFASVLPMK